MELPGAADAISLERRRMPATPRLGTGDGTASGGGTRRLDRFDWAILAVLALLSCWLLGLLLWRVIAHDRVWSGTDGLGVGDQVQYLTWIREASEHVLISNRYRLESTAHSFLHPGVAVSGLPAALGVPVWLVYLLWKPAAVIALFAAVRAYARSVVAGLWARRSALVLGLFFVAPGTVLGDELAGSDFEGRLALEAIAHDMWAGFWLWGLPFTAIAVALLVAALLAYERDRGAARVSLWAPFAGFTCSWLQPWQGATLITVLLGAEVISAGVARQLPGRAPLKLLGATVAAAAAPLVYYAILAEVDSSWGLAGTANRSDPWPWWTLAVSIAPLAAPALLAYRVRPVGFQQSALRVWPLAAVGIYWFIGATGIGTFPLHALQGLSIPLAAMAVIGVGSLPGASRGRVAALVAAAAVVLVTVPATLWELREGRRLIDSGRAAFFLEPGERAALDYLESHPAPGGVLPAPRLGGFVPAYAGRRTWVGSLSWTPGFARRADVSARLFSGQLGGEASAGLVRRSGARFLLADCRSSARIDALRGLPLTVRRFGCATVYEVRR